MAMTEDARMRPDPPDDGRSPTDGPDGPDGPEGLVDGRTIEELADYLHRGRMPLDPAIEGSAACRLALANLARLAELSAQGLRREADRDPDRDAAWISGLLEAIGAEVRSGRDIPISHPDPTLRLTLTEAAVRGIVRRAGDGTPGVIMGRCALHGDVGTPGAVIRVDVTCTLEFPLPVAEVADLLRIRIRDALARHAELTVGDVDVTVEDIRPPAEAAAPSPEEAG
jgi:hypothetical protein